MDMMPNPPGDLKAGALSGGAHLPWKDNSDNEGGFMIERMVGAAAYATLASVPFDTTQYHDAPLTAGTTYMYRVMAMPKAGGHDSGTTKYSNEVNFAAP
ncbi:MAG: fibronectin type III domain-containing protein [Myxococcales bacterium]